MTKTKKYITIPMLSMAGLYFLTLLVALIFQTTIHNKYGKEFNDRRIELGVYPIDDFQTIENEYWSDYCPDDPFKRWTEILTNADIANLTIYTNSDTASKPFHKQKIVLYGTQLCFWQNYYGGEIDSYIKPIDNESYMELFVVYYSDNVEPSNYFFADLDTIYKGRPPIVCGTPFAEEYQKANESFPRGNLTKEQADNLLIEWKIKVK